VDHGAYRERFSESFQRHALAVLSRSPSLSLRFRSVLDPQYFSTDAMRCVASALLRHVDSERAVPHRETLAQTARELAGEKGREGVDKLVSALYADDVGDEAAVAAKLVAFGKQRAMVNAVLKAASRIDAGDSDAVLPLIQEAQQVGADVLDIGISYHVSDERKTWYESDGDEEYIPTGIVHLDEAMGGGLGRGELGCIFSPPKRGKTSALINFAFGAITSHMGYNVVYYSCEMADRKIARRLDARLSGPYFQYRGTDPEKYVAGLAERARSFVRGRLVVKSYPTRKLTPTMIRSHLSVLEGQGFRPDLLIVDYADIMRAERRLGEMRNEQAGIYEDLREIAGDYNVAVWTGSQAKRDSLDKDILTIADLAESFEKAAIVDAAVAFCQSADEVVDRRCRLVLAAMRETESGCVVVCSIDRARCKIVSTDLLDPSQLEIRSEGDGGDRRRLQRKFNLRKPRRRDE